MMSKSCHRGVPYFQIFARGIVFGDVGCRFVTHSLVDGALPGNRGLTRGFRAAACLFHLSPVLGSKPAHFCGPFALAQLMTGSLFQFGNIRGLVASISLPFGAHFTFR
jgi:hypothetical protein